MKPELSKLLDRLGFPPDKAGFLEEKLSAKNRLRMPWYIRLGAFTGSFIAAIAFIVAFVLLTLHAGDDFKGVYVAIGLALLVAGVITSKHDAISMAAVLSGQILFSIGIIAMNDSGSWSVFLQLLALIQVILFVVYKNGIYHFASIILFFFSLGWLGIDAGQPVFLSVLLAAAAAAFTALHIIQTHPTPFTVRHFRAITSAMYSLGIVLAGFSAALIPGFQWLREYSLNGIAAGVTGIAFSVLAYLCLVVENGMSWKLFPLVLLPFWAAFGLTWQFPGFAGSCLLLISGFRFRRVPMMVLGVAGIGAFFSFYYYFLELTLLQKSLVLLGAGAVFLGGTLAFRYIGKGRNGHGK